VYIAAFWDVTLCSLVHGSRLFNKGTVTIYRIQYGDRKLHRNCSTKLHVVQRMKAAVFILSPNCVTNDGLQ
jgi:hypothetical protein